MKQWHMVTVVGKDRAGIVAALTDALYRASANLGEASMVRLGGNFTVMMMVQAEADASGIEQWLAPVARTMGLRVHVDPIEGQLHAHVEPNAHITVHGADRPGIVAQVTAVLAAHGFNILDLDSDVAGSADKPVYVMLLEGHTVAGIESLERVLAPLRQGGIEVRVTSLETMVG